MKEIKFRGKRKDTGEWVYGYYYKKPSGKNYIYNSQTRLYREVDPTTVGQYTGLKDKHGREIYTDDIIRIGEMGGEAGRVIFDTACLAYMVVNEHQWTGAYRLGDFDGSDITIVGNIHENPKLLDVDMSNECTKGVYMQSVTP